jgi:hypothetical protein
MLVDGQTTDPINARPATSFVVTNLVICVFLSAPEAMIGNERLTQLCFVGAGLDCPRAA